MSQSRCRELAEQLLNHYEQLYDYSKKQQLILTGQLDSDFQTVVREREELFAKIEQLQNEFQKVEQDILSANNITNEIREEISTFRKAFQKTIHQILKSDEYLQVIIEERKRQLADSIQRVMRVQNAEIQYRKASINVPYGHLFPDQSRFFDDSK